MADTIKIFGSNVPKPVALGGGAAILIGGVFYYRKNKQNAAAQASVDAAGTNEIDPATGYPYGSPEDAAALNAQNNYISPSGAGGYSGGVNTAQPYGSGAGPFTTNADWAQFVEQYEVNNMGADAPTVGNAIGKYITGQALTTDAMISIVQSAIAIGGYPPVPGPNGHPPGYVTVPIPPTPTPSVYPHNPPTGLHVTKPGRTGVQIGWNKVTNAKSYTVHRLAGGGLPDSKSNTTNTYFNLGSLRPNTSYTIQLWANPTPTGGPHAQIVVKTTK
jgi:hypothetical protein